MNLFNGIIRFGERKAEFNGAWLAEESGIQVMFTGSFFNLAELSPGSETPAQALLKWYRDGAHPDFTAKINGLFAFVVYDRERQKLLAARDRLGAMPMFYFATREVFAFAHTLSRLKVLPEMPRELDLQAIHDYLALQYIPCPRTLYKNVYKMRPGSIFTMNPADGQESFSTYWKPDFSHVRHFGIGEAAEELRGLVTQAVKRRIPADKSYASLLSGGLDSTIITGLTAQNTPHPLKTLTMGFDNPDYDERDRADFAVETINHALGFQLDHHVRVATLDNFNLFKELVSSYGEPYADASLLPTYLLCRWAREENLNAVFNGDAADELFAGYERYLVMRYAEHFKLVPRCIFRAAAALLPRGGNERSKSARLLRTCRVLSSPPEQRYFDIISRFSEDARRTVYDGEMYKHSFTPSHKLIHSAQLCSGSKNIVAQMQEVDMRTYMPGDVLPKAAIAVRAAGVAALPPFLDNDVIDFAMTLPLNFKQNGISRKHLLKLAFPEFIPPQIAIQRKKGFGVPVGEWLKTGWHELLREHLLEGNLIKSGYFKQGELAKMIETHKSGSADLSYPLWSLLVLDLFL